MRKNKPSQTAYKVALSVVMLGSDSEFKKRLPPGISEAVAQVLIESGVVNKTLVHWALQGKFNKMAAFYERLLPRLYGDVYRGLGYRKVFFERQVREAIGQGAQQVLVFGGGYDTLTWRLSPEFPEVHFIEIDHPATGRGKAQSIQCMGDRPNLELIQADLGQTKLKEVLKISTHWNPGKPTVFMAEGLLMYLPITSILSLFKASADLCAPGSRLLFDHLLQRDDGKPDIGPFTDVAIWGLKLIGEPFLWSIQPQGLYDFVIGTGWQYSPELIGTPKDYKAAAFAVLSR